MRLTATVLMLLAVCACGDSSNPSSAIDAPPVATLAVPTTALPPGPPRATLPATTLLVEPTRNDSLVDAATPTLVTDPCPESTGGPDGTAAMGTELAKLEPMLGVVLAYGGQHPAEFGSYGLVWHGTNDASVFISFTSDLERHRDALSGLVAHPDELTVCQVALSGDVARALAARLTEDLSGRFVSVAIGANGVEVVLKEGEEALAAQLVAQYGSGVDVTLCPADVACSAQPLGIDN